ncbi:hypothetical protein F511_09946 [Dorcoceras hygrometricum]|uniref:Uncharacterized protein n=1 Tax=Dorcoceras hygrometricum TaxID=472368 RepID=A0A2Z7ACY6_9LAMI|nr:hypothetical protein F511_09946 [Dorcoceras hygrometricum]
MSSGCGIESSGWSLTVNNMDAPEILMIITCRGMSLTVRVISLTVHGVGYRPLPYEPLFVGQHSMQQNVNFSTLSIDSHQSSAGPSGCCNQYDVFAPHQSSAGPSGNVDLYDVFASHQSSAGPLAPSYVYDTVMS